MDFLDDYMKILVKFDLKIEYDMKFSNQIGLGDLLILKLLQEYKIIDKIYINIYLISKYHNNPLNAFEFKLQLLNELKCDYGVTYNTNLSQTIPDLNTMYHYIKDYKIDIPKSIVDTKYIVFHTKCRFDSFFDYQNFKTCIGNFYKNFKTKFKCIILGERTFPDTWEGNIHKITTIYDELLQLKNNNIVIDMSTDSIYDNLDYNKYLYDRNLIQNANYNILCGNGGQFVISLCYSQQNIIYTKNSIINQSIIFDNRTNIFFNIDDFICHLNKILN